jgi:hypothetical protein
MTTRQIYLKNKDILAQIHKSKMTYCWVADRKQTEFDVILSDLSQFHNRKTKAQPDGALNVARKAKSDRIKEQAYNDALADWEKNNGRPSQKPKQNQFEVDPKKINAKDLIVRIMTWDHIPLEPGRKKNPKSEADRRAKVNFPPFKHFKQNDEGEWVEIVRSHWKGDLDTGKFSVTHGKINNVLGSMFLKLCDRYSLRANWRGYSYIDEMRGQALIQLTQIGLQFDESKSQNPFAYYTAAITNSFTRVLNVEKRQRDIRDDLLQEAGQTPSWTRQIEYAEKMAVENERREAIKEEALDNDDNDNDDNDDNDNNVVDDKSMIGHNHPPGELDD